MRFSDSGHLQAFKDRGEYPAIHEPFWDFVVTKTGEVSICDVACCFGLLGQRLSRAGFQACGIEANPRFIQAARTAGVNIPILELKVTRRTIEQAARWIEQHQCGAIVCRRAMPELWESDLEGGRLFAERMAEARVREVFLQGRVVSPRAVSPLASLKQEVDLFARWYRVTSAGKLACVKMVRR
jgi:hypothetical protein